MNKIISEIQALQEVVTRFRQMRLDATEFACLKCIVTFKAGEYGYITGYLTVFSAFFWEETFVLKVLLSKLKLLCSLNPILEREGD